METLEQRARSPALRKPKKDPVKLTALLYLREALLKERYEQAPEFIAVAREFSAADWEIEELLEDARRMPR